jgi:hypothetical protein
VELVAQSENGSARDGAIVGHASSRWPA